MSVAHKHIQREKSKYNIQIFKRDIKTFITGLFDDALSAYNAKQKRKDRRSMIIINTSRSPLEYQGTVWPSKQSGGKSWALKKSGGRRGSGSMYAVQLERQNNMIHIQRNRLSGRIGASPFTSMLFQQQLAIKMDCSTTVLEKALEQEGFGQVDVNNSSVSRCRNSSSTSVCPWKWNR